MKRNFQSLWSPARVLPVFLSLGKQMCIASCPEGWQNRAVTEQEEEFWTWDPAVALRWSSGVSLQCCGAGQPLAPATLPGWHRPGTGWWTGLFPLSTASQPRCAPAGRAGLVPMLWHIPGMSEGEKRCPERGQGVLSLLSPCGSAASRMRGSCTAGWGRHCTGWMGISGSFFFNEELLSRLLLILLCSLEGHRLGCCCFWAVT